MTGRSWKSFEVHARKSQECHEWTARTTMDVKDNSGESSEEKKKSGKRASIFIENT